MPILLDDIQNQVSQPMPKIFSPKFFDSKLTGTGKKIGVLNQMLNPVNCDPNRVTTSENTQTRKYKYVNGQTSVNLIPVNILTYDGWSYMQEMERPDLADMTKIAEKPASGNDPAVPVYAYMPVHSIVLEETNLQLSQGNSTSRKCTPCYQLLLYTIEDQASTLHINCANAGQLCRKGVKSGGNPLVQAKGLVNGYYTDFTCNPMKTLNDILSQMTSMGFVVDNQACSDFVNTYDLYSAMQKRSEEWQTTIDRTLDKFFENIVTFYPGNNAALNETVFVLRRIEDYSIPLDLYRTIYKSIRTRFAQDVGTTLCKHNLNLLLSDTLNNLEMNKAQLTHVQSPVPPAQVPMNLARFSPEQQKAVTSQEPLVLVQAGAGTGKALPLDTPILTPKGWTTMGELEVGSIITGSNGKPCKVLRIHEQGLKSGYDLKFRDGSCVPACGEHLWTVHMIDHGKEVEKTITTEEWVNEPKYFNHAFLPMVQPVTYEYGEKLLPIDPYFLGALLADGCLANNSVQYTKSETAVYQEVEKAAARNGYTMYDTSCETSTAKQWRFANPGEEPHTTSNFSLLKNHIRNMGLDVKSREKFIPEEYKTASVTQRKALLNGLFDGDGDIRTGHGYARFNTASDQLAEDVLQLLWSLGLAATKQRQTHKRGDYWSVNLLDNSWDPFVASEYAGKATGSVRPMRRSLVDFEPFEPVPMRCIEVDADDKLYVTKDFIVTHNSTVILGRIEYMCACGINPQDITVLSFTNAAANHITDKNPNVHSMTIARMIHNIYTANFKNHELSSIDTIINSIDIYYHGNDIADKFRKKCRAILKNDSDAFTSMNNFIEAHYDDVIAILDTIGQTSLELEIIICYQKIDTFVEPPDVQSKYLIIDEVQDNSIFEFIYTLKYVDKHKESLFIVGDCSQTLYEFRASNPKALNVLEASGVFTSYQLQVNYRSNQEILDFANVLLQNIEANQYASIQLRANSLATVTEQSFTDKVHFKYHQLAKISDMKDAMSSIFAIDIQPYIKARLAAGEQVAFLAFTRNEVYRMQNILKGMFPQANIVNLVPEKVYNTTIFSEFIKKYWSEVQFIPTTSITVVIAQEIVSRLTYLVHAPDKMLPIVQRMLATWRSENQNMIDSWQRQHMSGRMSLDVFLNNVKECMLQFEIRSNAVRQALISSRNEEQKKAQNSANANMILSTIHSAKGLEFDNVVVVYRNKSELEESEKRMYYVAFTRAMKTEFILAYDTVKSPRIESDYNTIVENLHKTHPKPVSVPVQANTYAQQAQQVLASQAQAAAVQNMTDEEAFDAALAGNFPTGQAPAMPVTPVAPAPVAPAQTDDTDDESAGFDPGNYPFTFNPAPEQ